MNIFKKELLGLSLLVLFISVSVLSSSSPPERFDVLIKNTTIVDGTGREAFTGDVVAFPPIVQPEGYPVGSEIMRPPPLAFNMYADYLGNYVREKRYLSLEEAVQKATSLPAKLLGLEDRGTLGEGVFADLVIFDFQKIRPKTDFRKPAQPPEGIEYVLVNGQLVYEKSAHTGLKPGRVLRRK